MEKENDPKLISDLHDFLAHGDDKHREWLFQAIFAFFNNLPRPPVN